jgi:hypothetical protein
MTFPRSSLRRLTPMAFAVFLAGGLVPRAALYTHHHAGGDHPHVHGDAHEAHVHPHVHPHPHRTVMPASGGPMLADADSDGGTHVHWQSPFQRATACPTATLLRGEACVAHATAEPREPHTGELPPARSRAPPTLLPA